MERTTVSVCVLNFQESCIPNRRAVFLIFVSIHIHIHIWASFTMLMMIGKTVWRSSKGIKYTSSNAAFSIKKIH